MGLLEIFNSDKFTRQIVRPARELICYEYGKVSHFAKLCKSFKLTTGMNLVDQPLKQYNPSLT